MVELSLVRGGVFLNSSLMRILKSSTPVREMGDDVDMLLDVKVE